MSTSRSNYLYQKLADEVDVEEQRSEEDQEHRSRHNGLLLTPSSEQSKPLQQWHILRIPFRHFMRLTIALPVFAFSFCVFWALHTDYEKATNVLCTREQNRPVKNYLPSLSAAIGDFQGSQLVWKICIVAHTPGRLLIASIYLRYLRKVVLSQYLTLAAFACALNVLEILSLLGLTLVTSKRNLPVHAACFGSFVVASEMYMIILCVLQSSCRGVDLTKLEGKSLRVKKALVKISIVCSIGLIFTYFRHEAYCEEGVYTLFALLEYIVVMANIAFHGSGYWDFFDRVIIIDFCEPCKIPMHKWDY